MVVPLRRFITSRELTNMHSGPNEEPERTQTCKACNKHRVERQTPREVGDDRNRGGGRRSQNKGNTLTHEQEIFASCPSGMTSFSIFRTRNQTASPYHGFVWMQEFLTSLQQPRTIDLFTASVFNVNIPVCIFDYRGRRPLSPILYTTSPSHHDPIKHPLPNSDTSTPPVTLEGPLNNVQVRLTYLGLSIL